MPAIAVFYLLGWVLAAVAAAMLVPASFAVALDSLDLVQAFVVPAFVVGFLGGSMIIAFRKRERFSSRRQNLLLLALVWLVVPVAAALPLYTAGFPKFAIPAYFEATSGFTTTGATVLGELAQAPASIIVWRALLQWLGGLTTLLALASILGPLAGPDLLDRQLHLIGRGTHGTARHMMDAVRTITPLYGALTAACYIALMASGIPPFDAFCIALSTLSTGGFMPRDGTLALYGAPLADLVLAVFMVAGAVSIIWIRAILQMRWPLVRETREPFWIAGLVGVTGLAFAVSLLAGGEWDKDFAGVFHATLLGLATAASIVSTTGYTISERAHDLVPFMVLLGLCIVGGGRFSTAGGLKVHRLASMLRQLGRELRLLIYPHGVRPARYGAEARDRELVKAMWITLIAFVLVISAIAVVLAGTGVPFAGALLASAGSVSNIGTAYAFARAGDLANMPAYAQMTPLAQLTLCAGMIAGRVEILALLSIANVMFWRQ